MDMKNTLGELSVNNSELPEEFDLESEDNDGDDEDETKVLLASSFSRKGGLSKSSEKLNLKVQWNDSSGNKLAEVMEFQPSDSSDSDEEDSDSCFCAILYKLFSRPPEEKHSAR